MDKKIFKKIFMTYRDRIGTDPYLDWWLICLFNVICFVAVVGWSVSIYQQIKQGNFYTQPTMPIETKSALNKANLTKITEMFKAREVKSAQVQSEGVFTQDPSL